VLCASSRALLVVVVVVVVPVVAVTAVVVAAFVVVTGLVVVAAVVGGTVVVVATVDVAGTALGPVASGSVLVGSARSFAEAAPAHPSSASDVKASARRSTGSR
jgi:hypothetical protein